jgi:DNA-directed RNA polymerase specialized sigma24 family protein
MERSANRFEQINLYSVWQEFRNSLRNFIKSRVSNEQDAEDIFKGCLLKFIITCQTLKSKISYSHGYSR